jgi:predicted metal-dependent hydrolase
MGKTEQAYHHAAGRCLDAMQALRRFNGTEAVEELKAAIRAIEDEQRRAQREDRLRFRSVQAAPPPPSEPDPF